MLIRAHHDQMKAHVRTAIRDLIEASRLLNDPRLMSAEILPRMIDAIMESASLRLKMVEEALTLGGPDANTL